MHARPAALLARTARQFEADVTIHDGRTWANAKNILDILQLCVKQGEKLAIVAKGIDARRAVHAIQELFTHHRLDFDPPPPG
jgi:phosphotransferase system HPr (HPr) family protein